FAIFVLYALRVLRLAPWEIGVLFAAGSVGAIIGALVVNRLQKAIGVGPAIVADAALFALPGILIPLAPKSFPLPFLFTSLFITQFGGVVYNVTQISLRQAITPERLQGRMNAAMRWIVWGTIPLGTLAGGVLATVFSYRTTLFVGAIGGMPAFLFVALSPLRSLRELPTPVVAPGPPAPADA
ncbi:MAG TPA: MFS transporter, partial [Gaiellaceae bacterium]|nr:MFS transporter [Gaiellaceae bacterium]